jgi:hypothetical protein
LRIIENLCALTLAVAAKFRFSIINCRIQLRRMNILSPREAVSASLAIAIHAISGIARLIIGEAPAAFARLLQARFRIE